MLNALWFGVPAVALSALMLPSPLAWAVLAVAIVGVIVAFWTVDE